MSESVGSFDALYKKIIQDAVSQYEKTIDDSVLDAKNLLNKVYNELTEKFRDKTKEVDALAASTGTIILSRALLQAREQVLKARQEIRDELKLELNQSLIELASSKEYDGLLSELLKEGALMLGLSEVKVYAREKDIEILRKAAESQGLKVNFYKIDCYGGLIIANMDDSIKIDSTLEALSQRSLEINKDKIERLLFGE
ncbi:MAG: V-type ATP synthase subunit E [Thermoprotei archaeon]